MGAAGFAGLAPFPACLVTAACTFALGGNA